MIGPIGSEDVLLGSTRGDCGCSPPVRGPASDGMSERFVKTLKRDYARLAIPPDAETILAKLPGWIEDYSKVHAPSGLKFRSPRESIRLSA